MRKYREIKDSLGRPKPQCESSPPLEKESKDPENSINAEDPENKNHLRSKPAARSQSTLTFKNLCKLQLEHNKEDCEAIQEICDVGSRESESVGSK